MVEVETRQKSIYEKRITFIFIVSLKPKPGEYLEVRLRLYSKRPTFVEVYFFFFFAAAIAIART